MTCTTGAANVAHPARNVLPLAFNKLPVVISLEGSQPTTPMVVELCGIRSMCDPEVIRSEGT